MTVFSFSHFSDCCCLAWFRCYGDPSRLFSRRFVPGLLFRVISDDFPPTYCIAIPRCIASFPYWSLHARAPHLLLCDNQRTPKRTACPSSMTSPDWLLTCGWRSLGVKASHSSRNSSLKWVARIRSRSVSQLSASCCQGQNFIMLNSWPTFQAKLYYL